MVVKAGYVLKCEQFFGSNCRTLKPHARRFVVFLAVFPTLFQDNNLQNRIHSPTTYVEEAQIDESAMRNKTIEIILIILGC